MSLETEVKAAEVAVEGEAKKIEGEVKSEVAAVEVKAETVAKAVEAEVKAATVAITSDEKLFLADTELEFLKVQAEIKRLTDLAEGKQKAYTTYVENLFTKYAVTKAEYV